VLGQQAPLLIC